MESYTATIYVKSERADQTFTVNLSITVGQFKTLIKEAMGVPEKNQTLSYSSKILDDSETLASYEIGSDSSVNLFIEESTPEPIEVFVRMWNSDVSENFEVDRNVSVQKVKSKIRENPKFSSIYELSTEDNKRSLDDNKLLSDYGIKDGDILLAASKLTIVIRIPDGRTMEVDVAYSNRIEDIKQQLEKKLEVSLQNQVLIYSAEELKDHRTITEAGIDSESIVVLVIKEEIKIIVKSFVSKSIELSVESYKTIEDVKRHVKNELKLPDQIDLVISETKERLDDDSKPISSYGLKDGATLEIAIPVQVQLPSIKEMMTLEAYPTQSVKSLKERLAISSKIPIEYQVLGHATGILEDTKELLEYPLQKNSKITLSAKQVCLFVEFKSEKEMFKLESNALVSELQKQVADIFKLKMNDDLRISFKDVQLEKEKLLLDYQLKDDDILICQGRLDSEMEIMIRAPNNQFQLVVKLSDTVAMIKEKIYQLEGIPVSCQKLLHAGNFLSDSMTVSEADVASETSLVVVIDEKLQVLVKTSTGKTGSLNLYLSQTIKELTDLVKTEFGLQEEDVVMLHSGRVLEEEKALSDYEIQKDTALLAVIREKVSKMLQTLLKDLIELNKPVSLSVKPSETPRFLKNHIQNIWKIPAEYQVLKHDQKVLEDNKTLVDHGIANNAEIEVTKAEPFDMVIKSLSGDSSKDLKIKVDVFENVLKLKEQIKEKTGLLVEDQMLVFNETKLEDQMKLSHYGIKADSLVFLIRKAGVEHFFWKDSQGNLLVLEADEECSIKEVKKMFKTHSGVPVSKIGKMADIFEKLPNKISSISGISQNEGSQVEREIVSAFF